MSEILKLLIADASPAVRQIIQHAAAQVVPALPIELVEAHASARRLEQGDIDIAFIDADAADVIAAGDAVETLTRRKPFVTLMANPQSKAIFASAERCGAFEFLIKPFLRQEVEVILHSCQRLSFPMKVLILDQSMSVRKIIQKVLAASVYRLEVGDADLDDAAVEFCRSKRPDVVFLDCSGPEGGGLDTVQQLLEICPRAKIVMMSVERNHWQERLAFRRGAAAFLRKPFYPVDIDVILHRLCGLNLPQVTSDAGGVVADFDVRVQGRTVAVEHHHSHHIFQFLWFRDLPYLRSGLTQENGTAASPAKDFQAEAERVAVMELRRAALLNPPILESLAG